MKYVVGTIEQLTWLASPMTEGEPIQEMLPMKTAKILDAEIAKLRTELSEAYERAAKECDAVENEEYGNSRAHYEKRGARSCAERIRALGKAP